MKYALVDVDNIVINIIVYNPSNDWIVPENMRVLLINDWLNIGDNINKEVPIIPAIDPQTQLANRNLALSQNYGVAAGFKIEKNLNPALDFATYVTDLLASQIAI